MSRRFLRIAVVWFLACVSLGAYMGATHRFGDVQVHVHGNLLGWVSCSLFALIHHAWPRLGASRAAKMHFWLHNVGLAAFVLGLVLLPRGVPAVGPLLGMSSVALVLATALFALAVWRATARQASPVHATTGPGAAPARA